MFLLQLLGIPFKRALVAARPSKRLKTSHSQALGPATPAEAASQQQPEGSLRNYPPRVQALKQEPAGLQGTSKEMTNAAPDAPLRLSSSLWVEEFPLLQRLEPLEDSGA